MKIKTLLFTFILCTIFSNGIIAQQISVDADSFEQEFVGTGASCGLYIGHYLSMSEKNQLKASKMLYDDLKLNWIKEYQGEYPWEKPKAYDNIVTAISHARLYNPDINFMVCANNLPDHLEEKKSDGRPKKGEYDPNIPGIMDSIANYYFHICKGYYDRGVTVDILELVNERGYKDGKVTNLYDIAADKFKAMVNNPDINKTGVPMPLIAGPSTWSAASTKVFIDGWKKNRPNAWENVDIVTSHGYENGTEANYFETYTKSEGKPFFQSEQTGKLQRKEKPGTDVIAEQFPASPYNPTFVANASIARHMIDFFNGRGNAFFAFLTNTHKKPHNAGLISTKWGRYPEENSIYSGFKHLSATHPLHSHMVNRDLTDMDSLKAVAFRKKGEDTVYVHFVNLYNTFEQVTVDFKAYGIKSAEVWRTDEFNEFKKIKQYTFGKSIDKIAVNATPYSVHTVKVVIDPKGASNALNRQTITFDEISDKTEIDGVFELKATASSGLPIQYEVLSGPVTLNGNTLEINGIGPVRIKAKQAGNDEYSEAPDVMQRFFVMPSGINVVLNKPVVASSQSPGFGPEKMVDGDKSSENSRWASNPDEAFPQWIEFKLQENWEITALSLFSGENGYNRPVWEFEFQVWKNAKWETVIKETDNVESVYLKQFDPVKTQKVRVYMKESPRNIKKYYASVYEVQVYGKHGATGEPLLNQTIAFDNIEDKTEIDDGFELKATASSGLPVKFEVVNGPAAIDGNTLNITGIGIVKVKAIQEGNDEYLESESEQRFFVWPAGTNVVLNKPTTASSKLISFFGPEKAVDGDISSELSRWITSPFAEFPHWIEIDLEENWEINALTLRTGERGYNSPFSKFKFQAWKNNQWVNIIEESDNEEAIYLKAFEPVKTHKVRLYIEEASAYFYTSLYEMQVFGKYGTNGEPLQNQSITFEEIQDKYISDNEFVLNASASSGLPVEFEVISGPITISGDTVKMDGIGFAKIRAKQTGNDEYLPAPEIEQSFFVWPAGINLALNKPVSASSKLMYCFGPEKAVDGNTSSDNSRWLTSPFEQYPQWIEIDLQKNCLIGSLILYSEDYGYRSSFPEFEFQVWENNEWKTIKEESGNTSSLYLAQFSPVKTDRVRLYIEETPGSFYSSLYEIQVYGQYDTTETPVINNAIGSFANADFKATKDIAAASTMVYPNPASTTLHLNGYDPQSKISVINLSGQNVLEAVGSNSLDVSNLPNGVYILSVDGVYQTEFIKK